MGRDATPSPEQIRNALREISESPTFARADQLRNFLNFVCRLAVEGRTQEISEYRIAIEALGRPPEFSPADDSSVRSRAHELRHRLQRYYQQEGAESTVCIDIPKGSYVPHFLFRTQPEDPPEAPPPPSPPPLARNWNRWLAAGFAISLVAAAVFAVLYFRGRSTAKPADVVREVWGPLVRRHPDVLISVSTPLQLLVFPGAADIPHGQLRFKAPPEVYSLYRQRRPLPLDGELDMRATDNSVYMGQMGAVVLATQVLHNLGASYEILPERSTPVAAVRGRNAVLVGDPDSSETVAQFLEKAPVTLEFDHAARVAVVRDRRYPNGGGLNRIPVRGPDNRLATAYGLISMVRANGPDPSRRILIFSGISSAGANGAAEFFSSADALRSLRARFRNDGLLGFPTAYQVVVRCRSKDTLLVRTEYEGHVVLER